MPNFPPLPDKATQHKPIDPGKPGPQTFDETPPGGPSPPPPPPPPQDDDPIP